MSKNKSYIPNVKVMASGLGGTISALIIDLIQVRGGIDLTHGELTAIVVFSSLLVAYFVPEPMRQLLMPVTQMNTRDQMEALFNSAKSHQQLKDKLDENTS